MVEYRPASLQEALKIASQEKVTPLAGGTDLMVRFKSPFKKEACIEKPLFLGELSEMKGICREKGFLMIGAGETLSCLSSRPEIPPVFREALSQIGSPAIRNQGTLGGNICNASPAGDSLPLLYLFKADMVLVSSTGERIVPLADFITGPGRTVREEGELLWKIRIGEEYLSDKYFYIFEKMGNRKADAISKASFALRLSLERGKIIDMDAAFGAMGPKVTLLNDEIRQLFLGRDYPLSDLDGSALREKLYRLLTPIDDQRSTADYRRRVALNLLSFHMTTDQKK